LTSETRFKLNPLVILDAMGVSIESKQDERGILTRIWEENTKLRNFSIIQASHVLNPICGTLRGLHYQSHPYAENKMIQCVSGRVYDVILDLRKESLTYKKHVEIEIGPDCFYQGVLVPAGCAHGYMTLEPNSTLIYFMDQAYLPESSRGVNWNDPKLSVNWPNRPILISPQDLDWPGLDW
jgi:dTDP-4-dehydrorhamnose 3,5-epimerase